MALFSINIKTLILKKLILILFVKLEKTLKLLILLQIITFLPYKLKDKKFYLLIFILIFN